MAFSLASSAFPEAGTIDKKHTCDGSDVSPPLSWKDPPPGAKSFALIVVDPDAPAGAWVHWVLYNVPGTAASLEEGLDKQESLPNGAKNGASWGVNDFSRIGYQGPCPPPGKPHRYVFKLYALDTMLSMPAKAGRFDIEKAMKEHVLAETQLMGKYGR